MAYAHVIGWDRGRPARNEREARTALFNDFQKDGGRLRDCVALRAGRPRSQSIA